MQPVWVLGRGIAGLSAAFELLKRNIPVTVIGPSAGIKAATRAAVGLSSLKGQFHATKPLFKAKVEGHIFLWPWLQSVEEKSQIAIPKFRANSYEPYWSLTEYEGIRERVFHRAFSGQNGAQFERSAPDIASLFSRVPTGYAVYDGDIWFDPEVCLLALERAIRLLGGVIIEDEISRISGEQNQILMLGSNDSYKSEHLILACGAYGDEILENSGMSGPRQRPVYGETVVADRFSHACPQIVHMGQRHLISFNGKARYGSSSCELSSVSALSEQIDGNLHAVLALDSRLAAHEHPHMFSTRYSGLRGRYKDIAPCIGTINLPQSPQKVVLFSGFYKSGLQLAPLFAYKLASYFSGSSAFLCESQFSITRFSPPT